MEEVAEKTLFLWHWSHWKTSRWVCVHWLLVDWSRVELTHVASVSADTEAEHPDGDDTSVYRSMDLHPIKISNISDCHYIFCGQSTKATKIVNKLISRSKENKLPTLFFKQECQTLFGSSFSNGRFALWKIFTIFWRLINQKTNRLMEKTSYKCSPCHKVTKPSREPVDEE